MVYDEFYCEYANILNEINETRLKKNANMINYQAIINQIEVAQEKSEYLEKNKQKLKEKNEIYNQIIDKCNKKFESCKKEFEQKINDEFLVISSLQVIDEINIFKKLARKISNIFTGNEKYLSALDEYSKKVDKIDAREIVNQMREETIDFVEEILTLRDFDEDNLADVG
jgi:mevalonate kinase